MINEFGDSLLMIILNTGAVCVFSNKKQTYGRAPVVEHPGRHSGVGKERLPASIAWPKFK